MGQLRGQEHAITAEDAATVRRQACERHRPVRQHSRALTDFVGFGAAASATPGGR